MIWPVSISSILTRNQDLYKEVVLRSILFNGMLFFIFLLNFLYFFWITLNYNSHHTLMIVQVNCFVVMFFLFIWQGVIYAHSIYAHAFSSQNFLLTSISAHLYKYTIKKTEKREKFCSPHLLLYIIFSHRIVTHL